MIVRITKSGLKEVGHTQRVGEHSVIWVSRLNHPHIFQETRVLNVVDDGKRHRPYRLLIGGRGHGSGRKYGSLASAVEAVVKILSNSQ